MNEPSKVEMMFVRALGLFVGVGMLIVSYGWSVDGFGELAPKYIWIGRFLGAAITAYELIWNMMKDRTNHTMFAGGLIAYAYGIGTNFLGISLMFGIAWLELITKTLGGDWVAFGQIIGGILAVGITAFCFEALPEPTIVWAVTGRYNGGDFLGNIFGQKQHAISSRSTPLGQHYRNSDGSGDRGNYQPPMQQNSQPRMKPNTPPSAAFAAKPNKQPKWSNLTDDNDMRNDDEDLETYITRRMQK